MNSNIERFALCKRIVDSYNFTLKYQEKISQRRVPNMWENHLVPWAGNVTTAAYNKNIEDLAYLLKNPKKHSMLWGIDNHLCKERNEMSNNIIKQVILNTCYSIGILHFPNPEHPRYSILIEEHRNYDIEKILIRFDDYFGFTIDFPSVFNDEAGLPCSRGLIAYRAAHALYFLHRMKESLPNDTDFTKLRVLELGGGIGRLAYYAAKMGVAKYTILDIPSTALIQGYFLESALGENTVSLYGEGVNPTRTINIIPPEEYLNIGKEYDIIVNFDGITEYGWENAKRYINHFPNICSIFLSINHEYNEYKVQQLYFYERNKFKCLGRFNSWYREGYIEETILAL